MRTFLRILLAIAVCGMFVAAVMRLTAAEAPSSVKVDASTTAPRQVEESTQQAIARDYSRAWQSMTEALDQNRPELLNPWFVGIAHDKLLETVKEQKQAGLHQRLIDHGHKVKVLFYSIDGSAIQLQDAAQLEIQTLDGDKVLHSENATVNYLALVTPAENSWRVRVLEAVPGS